MSADGHDSSSRCSSAARSILFGLLLASPLIFTGAALEAFKTPQTAVLQCGAAVLLALIAVVITGSNQGWRSLARDPLVLASLVILASAAASTMFSISPRSSFFGAIDSLAGLTTVAAYVIVLLATRLFVTTAEHARQLLAAPMLAAIFAAGYGLVQALRLDPYVWNASSTVGGFVRPFSTLGHANHLGGYLAATLPLTYFAWRRLRGWPAATAGAAVILSVIVIALTLSRGAWLALAAVVAVGAGRAIVSFRRRARGTQGSRLGPRVLAGLAAVAVIAGLWCASSDNFRRGVGERFERFTHGAGRLSLWRAGFAMAADHPLTGVGLDCYALAFGRYRPAEYWLSEGPTTPTRAHNEIIEILATQGVTGLAAFIAMLAAAVTAWRKVRARGADPELLAAVMTSLVAIGVYGLTSFLTAPIGALAAALVGVLGGLSGSFEPVRPAAPPVRWLVRIPAFGLALLVVVAGIVRPFVAEVRCRSADCRLLIDPPGAVAEFESAAALAPERDLLWFKLSQGARAAARETLRPAERRRLNDRARAAQETAMELVPAHPIHRAHYARLLNELCQEGAAGSDDVARAYADALDRDPRNPALLAEAGHAAWARGDRAAARRFLSAGIALDPRQANLRALSGLVALADGHFEEASEQLEAAARGEWRGNADGFWQSMSVWAACLVRLNRPSDAAAIAREVSRQRPGWPGPRYTLGYALAMLGRHEESRAAFAELAAGWPEHPLASEARKQLAR